MTSGAYCAVQGCKNQKTMKQISFFKLPVDVKRREDWLYMIGRPDLQKKPDLKPECHFVCHIHFEEFMMIRKPLLRPNAIPTKNIPTLPILNQAITLPTTKEDKSTQTRRKFYKELSCCKRGIDTDGEIVEVEQSGQKKEEKKDRDKKERDKREKEKDKEKKRKLKEKLAASYQKRKKLQREVEELKRKLEAANGITAKKCKVETVTSEATSSTEEVYNTASHVKPPVCNVILSASAQDRDTIVIGIDIKREPDNEENK